MKNPFIKLIFTMFVVLSLSACLGPRAQQAEENYTGNYGGYLVAKSDCKKTNFHEVNYVDSGGKDAQVKIAADCNDIELPQHGGEFVAQTEAALINAGGNIGAALITAGANTLISDDNNDTRVQIAELQNEREDSENAVLVEAISSRDSQTDALTLLSVSVTEQNATLTELVGVLTGDDSESDDSASEVSENEQ